MPTATPEPTPNPDAMKFTLDGALGRTINASASDETDDALAAAILELDGVASVFGINDFVTVTREPGADWEPIVAGVRAAVAEHL